MRIITAYRVKPDDTKRIREAWKAEGLTVKRSQLGSNRFYILIQTSDNRRARPIIEKLGFTLNPIWETTNEHLFQTDKMKFEKTTPN